MDKKASYEFIAEPFRCDLNGELMYSTLGNYMLNAADYHSAERGFGWKTLKQENKAWVLSRFVIEMNKMPLPYEHFNITTWMEKALRTFTYRHWAVNGTNGEEYGYGTSVWAMIDLSTRQPIDVYSVGNGKIKDYESPEDCVPIQGVSRVKADKEELELLKEIDVTYSDLDINRHINSIKYIEHVMDVYPNIQDSDKNVKRLEVAYVAESRTGEKLRFYGKEGGNYFLCIVTGLSMNEEKELVRCRIIKGI